MWSGAHELCTAGVGASSEPTTRLSHFREDGVHAGELRVADATAAVGP